MIIHHHHTIKCASPKEYPLQWSVDRRTLQLFLQEKRQWRFEGLHEGLWHWPCFTGDSRSAPTSLEYCNRNRWPLPTSSTALRQRQAIE